MLGVFTLCFGVNDVPKINDFGAAKGPNIKKIRGPRDGGLSILSGASFCRGDFAPREPEFGVEFWDANF